MASKQQDYLDDELDFDDEYFARTYRPLSNLPTPPFSSSASQASRSPRIDPLQSESHSALLGPAVHLSNLVPTSSSLLTPSVPFVHDMLLRADLTPENIALAVCILDTLSPRFSRNWRSSPLPASPRQPHIDCVPPEVIILASLMISFKFIEDCHERTRYFASLWGADEWTCEQINLTERCILESLDYRLLPLWDPELITEALRDMKRAGNLPDASPRTSPSQPRKHGHHGSVNSGKAIYGIGFQVTPDETPMSKSMQPIDCTARESAYGSPRVALNCSSPCVALGILELPYVNSTNGFAGVERLSNNAIPI